MILHRLPQEKTHQPVYAQNGFAMVEAVAALLITSLLFVMLTVAASFVLAGSVRSVERINEAEILHGGLDAWQREVAQAANPTAMALESDGAIHVFEGRSDGMRFVAASRGLDRPLEIVEFRAEGETLQRRADVLKTAFNELEISARAPNTAILAGNFNYRFDYRGRSANQTWQGEWLEQDVLPGFVRLSITDRTTRELVTATIAVVAVNSTGPCAGGVCEEEQSDEALQAWSSADVSQ